MYLKKAYDEVMRRAEGITDTKARESFLKNVKTHSEIVEIWEKQQAPQP